MPSEPLGETVTPLELSVVVPFDVGESYVFQVPNDRCERCIWRNIFTTANQGSASNKAWEWNTNRLGEAPAFYREPFGPIARYRLREPATDALKELAGTSEFYAAFTSLEVIFFTRGIGILVLRGSTRETVATTNWRKTFVRDREKLKQALLPTISEARRAYLDVMRRAAKKTPAAETTFVSSVRLQGRRREVEKTRFPHVIVFSKDDPPAKETKPRAATMSFEEPHGYHYLSANAATEITLRVDVGWGESTTYNTPAGSDAAQIAITEAFVTAMASWFSLVLMTSLVSQFLRVSFTDMANKRRFIRDQRGQAIRFMFMDTSNASRPVRWAFRERDILLLDRIHGTWTTKRWWLNVEERTTLLTAHHADVAADIRRVAEKRLGWLVVGLAAVTALTAVRDLTETIAEEKWVAFGLMIAVLLSVIVLGMTLLRERSEKLDE